MMNIAGIQIESPKYWTDAHMVLLWMKNRSKQYTSYVAHRLGEISELNATIATQMGVN